MPLELNPNPLSWPIWTPPPIYPLSTCLTSLLNICAHSSHPCFQGCPFYSQFLEVLCLEFVRSVISCQDELPQAGQCVGLVWSLRFQFIHFSLCKNIQWSCLLILPGPVLVIPSHSVSYHTFLLFSKPISVCEISFLSWFIFISVLSIRMFYNNWYYLSLHCSICVFWALECS